MDGQTWADLVPVSTSIHIFAYLDVSDLAAIASTCSHWASILRDIQPLWFKIAKNLQLDIEPGTEDFKGVVQEWAIRFRGLRGSYRRVRGVYLRLLEQLNQKCPSARRTLTRPLTRAEFDMRMLHWFSGAVNLPEDFICWLLTTGVGVSSGSPLFGVLPHTNMQELEFHPPPITVLIDSLSRSSVFVCAPYYRLNLSDTERAPKGSVWIEAHGHGKPFIAADSWIAFVENFVMQLEQGDYTSFENTISRWPQLGATEETTRDLKIRFQNYPIPFITSSSTYLYLITLSMDASAQRNRSKLCSRYWKITDENGRVEEVEGPGVVGLYPVIGPGDTFSYSSRCPFNTPNGTMEGYFVFEDLVTHEQWQCAVPRTYFQFPQTVTDATIAAGKVQSV